MIVLNWLLRSMTCKAVSTVRIIFKKRAVVFVVEARYAKPGMHEHKPGLTASNNLWHFAPSKSCRIKFTWGESTSTPDPKKHTYWTNFKLNAIYFYSQFRGDGGVSWHGLGGQFIVAVWAIEEGLSALVVTWEVGVEDQTGARGGLRVQGAAARRGSILHIEAENINAQLKSEFFAVSLFHCWEYGG